MGLPLIGVGFQNQVLPFPPADVVRNEHEYLVYVLVIFEAVFPSLERGVVEILEELGDSWVKVRDTAFSHGAGVVARRIRSCRTGLSQIRHAVATVNVDSDKCPHGEWFPWDILNAPPVYPFNPRMAFEEGGCNQLCLL